MSLQVHRTFLGLRFEVSESTWSRLAIAYVDRHQSWSDAGQRSAGLAPGGPVARRSRPSLRRTPDQHVPVDLYPAAARAAMPRPTAVRRAAIRLPSPDAAPPPSLRPKIVQAWEKTQGARRREAASQLVEATATASKATPPTEAAQRSTIDPAAALTLAIKAPWEKYLARMARRGAWGSTLEALALAQHHGISLQIFDANEGEKRYALAYAHRPPVATTTLDLVRRNDHYSYALAPLPSAGFAFDGPEAQRLGTVPKDGNCLFSSFAAHLGGGHTASSMRAEAVRWMRQNANMRLYGDDVTLAEVAMAA